MTDRTATSRTVTTGPLAPRRRGMQRPPSLRARAEVSSLIVVGRVVGARAGGRRRLVVDEVLAGDPADVADLSAVAIPPVAEGAPIVLMVARAPDGELRLIADPRSIDRAEIEAILAAVGHDPLVGIQRTGSWRTAGAALVTSLALLGGGCSSADEDTSAGWALAALDPPLSGQVAPEASGSFDDEVFIDRFLGPATWDAADGAPPTDRDRVEHSDLVAFGRLAEDAGDTRLTISAVFKGELADLTSLAALPVVATLPVDVVIMIGPDAEGRPTLLTDPYGTDTEDILHVLVGGDDGAIADPALATALAGADLVARGRQAGPVEGATVEVIVEEVFKGDGATVGSPISVDVGSEGGAEAEQPPGDIWFVAASGRGAGGFELVLDPNGTAAGG